MSLADIIEVYDSYCINGPGDPFENVGYLPENRLQAALITVETIECDCIALDES